MLSCNKITQCQRIDRLVVRPAENFIVHTQLGITVDFSQKVVPFSRFIGSLIDRKMQRMNRLPYMVARESELPLRYGMYEASVMRKHSASAPGTHKAVLPKHSKKIVLWIGYIEMVAVCASYYPLCL